MRNLISQNAICGTLTHDRAIYCSNSLSLRENRIIQQSVSHWNTLLGVMACVSLCVLYHQCFGSLRPALPPPDVKKKKPLIEYASMPDWIVFCMWPSKEIRSQGHSSLISAPFNEILKGMGRGKDHLSLWKQKERQWKQNLNANEMFFHLGQQCSHICPNVFLCSFASFCYCQMMTISQICTFSREMLRTVFGYVALHFSGICL